MVHHEVWQFACSSHPDFYLHFIKNVCRVTVPVLQVNWCLATWMSWFQLFQQLLCPEWLMQPMLWMSTSKRLSVSWGHCQIIAFSEAGFWMGIPRVLFLAKLYLEPCLWRGADAAVLLQGGGGPWGPPCHARHGGTACLLPACRAVVAC